MTTRDELVVALSGRYALSSGADRGRTLDEFAALTGHHRKHAMRLLRAGRSNEQSGPRPDRRIYDQATREALILVWEASDRICGKRLRPLVPILVSAMERHGHLSFDPRGARELAGDECRDDGPGVTGGARARGRTSAPLLAPDQLAG